jgi:hypothetical protein
MISPWEMRGKGIGFVMDRWCLGGSPSQGRGQATVKGRYLGRDRAAPTPYGLGVEKSAGGRLIALMVLGCDPRAITAAAVAHSRTSVLTSIRLGGGIWDRWTAARTRPHPGPGGHVDNFINVIYLTLRCS